MKIIKIVFAVLAALWALALIPKLIFGLTHSSGPLAGSHLAGTVIGILIATALSFKLFQSARAK